MSRHNYGSPIEPLPSGGHELRYSSPSTLTTADVASDGGCLRKAWYQVVQKIRSPTSKSQQVGIDLHAELEHYLRTSEKKFGSLALSGLHMVPDPGRDLLIEAAICETLDTAAVRFAGVPIVGYVDLAHARGTNKGGSDVEDTQDPPNTMEIIDFKTTGDPRWIKTPQEMSRTIQMTTYGKWATAVAPETEHVRLSHCYFPTKGSARPRKVTLRVLPEQIDRQVEHCESVARSLKHAVRESDPDRVDANVRSCDKYGGCPARSVCSAGMHAGLRAIVGRVASHKLGDTRMTLNFIEQLRKPANGANSPSNQAILSKEQEEILAEERAGKERRKFADDCAKVESFGMGFPQLSGAAARLHALINGYPSAAGFAGSGQIGTVVVDSPEMMSQLVDELAQFVASQPTPAVQPVISTPVQLAEPAPPPRAAPEQLPLPSLLPPEAPESLPVHRQDVILVGGEPVPVDISPIVVGNTFEAATIGTAGAAITTPPAKKRGRPPKVSDNTVVDRDAKIAPIIVRDDSLPVSKKFDLIIDAVVEGAAATSLLPFMDLWASELAAACKCDDIRFPEKGSQLEFGKWKGALAAVAREQAAALPPGTYTIDTRGSELAEVVADALRAHARATGGTIVRGIR